MKAAATAAIAAAVLFSSGAKAQGGLSMTQPPEANHFMVQASITGVVQQLKLGRADVGKQQRRGTFRGDISTTIPAPAPQGGQGTLFGHVRFGRGEGVTLKPSYLGAVNSVAFEQADGSSLVILAQLFYELDMPLAAAVETSSRVTLTVGKIDPFMFFDQNEVSDDETTGFLNNAFVHNPLLDAGGDIGADRFGFTPGVRAAWISNTRHGFSASFGAFGAGRGAEFRRSPGRPFLIAQIEVAPKRVGGDVAGHYRLYGWSNPQAADLEGLPEKHVGWGASIDHSIGSGLSIFARVGRRNQGQSTFNKALTVGVELMGHGWERPRDAIGLAVGRLSAGDGASSPRPRGTSEGTGVEKIVELFYRHTLVDQIEITPSIQLVNRISGDQQEQPVRVFGIRVKLNF
jgi:high affinity Mn2+ porin